MAIRWRQQRELIRVLDIARARALLRSALRELDELLAALRDGGRALGDVDQALLVVEQLLDARVHAVPARLDVLQQHVQRIVLHRVERDALDRAAALQRIEVRLEALAGVLHRVERDRPALQRQRGAAREPLREHLHLGRRRRGRRGLRRGPDVERHDERREHEERHEQDAEHLELPRDRQMADQRHLPGHPRARRRRAHLLHAATPTRADRSPGRSPATSARLAGGIDLRRDGGSGLARQRFPQIHCKRHGASR